MLSENYLCLITPIQQSFNGPKTIDQGFAIGNGLTDPAIQYQAYTDYALDMGIITQTDYDHINKIVGPCEFAIKLCGRLHVD